MMNALRKPLWPPSGKLWPQSRQFPDAYAEDLVAESMQAVAPNGWGLTRLTIDDAALADGVFRVVQAEGRFLSGAPLLIHARASLARALPPERQSPRAAVSLGIPLASDDAPNVTDDPQESAAVRHARVRVNDGAVLFPRVQLLFNDEGADSYERIPIASVSLGGRAWAEPWFLPPMLRLLPESPVLHGVREVVAALASRRAALLADRAARPLDIRAFAPTSAPHLLLLSIPNRALAVLDAPDLSWRLTPEEIHDLLASLLGSLEALGGRPALAPVQYAHVAPGPGFRALVERLVALIPEVVRSAHRVFPLQRTDTFTYSLSIDDPELLRRGVYLVAYAVSEAWVAGHLPAHAKIGSAQSLATIMNTATRGVPIAVEFDPPPFLPSSGVHCSFRVNVRSQHWNDVLESRSLVVHVPQAPPELALTVFVMPPEAR